MQHVTFCVRCLHCSWGRHEITSNIYWYAIHHAEFWEEVLRTQLGFERWTLILCTSHPKLDIIMRSAQCADSSLTVIVCFAQTLPLEPYQKRCNRKFSWAPEGAHRAFHNYYLFHGCQTNANKLLSPLYT